jgi:hypothetical protein
MSRWYCNKFKSQLTSPTPAQAASCCIISGTYSIYDLCLHRKQVFFSFEKWFQFPIFFIFFYFFHFFNFPISRFFSRSNLSIFLNLSVVYQSLNLWMLKIEIFRHNDEITFLFVSRLFLRFDPTTRGAEKSKLFLCLCPHVPLQLETIVLSRRRSF